MQKITIYSLTKNRTNVVSKYSEHLINIENIYKKLKVRNNIRLGKFTMMSQPIDLGWLVVCFDCIVLIAGLRWGWHISFSWVKVKLYFFSRPSIWLLYKLHNNNTEFVWPGCWWGGFLSWSLYLVYTPQTTHPPQTFRPLPRGEKDHKLLV